MTIENITEKLRQECHMGYVLLTQAQRRQFAGRAPGKARKMEVTPWIAAHLAKRIDYAMTATKGGVAADVQQIVDVIDRALIAVPEAVAYQTVAISTYDSDAARRDVVELITVALMEVFAFEARPFTGHPMIAPAGRGACAPGMSGDG